MPAIEQNFAGQTALVTGAAGDIGAAIVSCLLEAGAQVAAIDKAEIAFTAPAGSHARLLRLKADLADESQIEPCVADCHAALGPVTILVNCAAASIKRRSIELTAIEDWRLTLAVNLTAPFLLSRSVVPHMKAAGGGVIINIASQLGSVSEPGASAYTASKGGLIAMTRAMALDLGPHNIRVVSISPGAVMTGRMVQNFGSAEAVTEQLLPRYPIGRLGAPMDIAAAVMFAASPSAGFITGVDLRVEGGYTAK